MKILITGGAGFIGSYLVRKYLDMDHDVEVIDDFSTGLDENLPTHSRLTVYRDSILDQTALKRFGDVDLVIHLASIVGMKKVKEDANLTYTTATKGTENVLNSTGNAPVVLFSSSAVYGMSNVSNANNEKFIISEKDLLKYDGGIPGYATGKWQMEQIGLSHAKQGRDILIVRPFNVVGQRQRSNYGMVVPNFINAALKHAPLTVYGTGQQSRCFSDVDTFSDAMLKLIACKETWTIPGNIVNIGSNQSTTIQSLADMTVRLCNADSTLEYVPFHQVFKGQVDVQGRIPDVSKFNKLVSDIAWPSIEQIVDKILKYCLVER